MLFRSNTENFDRCSMSGRANLLVTWPVVFCHFRKLSCYWFPKRITLSQFLISYSGQKNRLQHGLKIAEPLKANDLLSQATPACVDQTQHYNITHSAFTDGTKTGAAKKIGAVAGAGGIHKVVKPKRKIATKHYCTGTEGEIG